MIVHQSDVLRLLYLQHGKQVFECDVMWEGVQRGLRACAVVELEQALCGSKQNIAASWLMKHKIWVLKHFV